MVDCWTCCIVPIEISCDGLDCIVNATHRRRDILPRLQDFAGLPSDTARPSLTPLNIPGLPPIPISQQLSLEEGQS